MTARRITIVLHWFCLIWRNPALINILVSFAVWPCHHMWWIQYGAPLNTDNMKLKRLNLYFCGMMMLPNEHFSMTLYMTPIVLSNHFKKTKKKVETNNGQEEQLSVWGLTPVHIFKRYYWCICIKSIVVNVSPLCPMKLCKEYCQGIHRWFPESFLVACIYFMSHVFPKFSLQKEMYCLQWVLTR